MMDAQSQRVEDLVKQMLVGCAQRTVPRRQQHPHGVAVRAAGRQEKQLRVAVWQNVGAIVECIEQFGFPIDGIEAREIAVKRFLVGAAGELLKGDQRGKSDEYSATLSTKFRAKCRILRDEIVDIAPHFIAGVAIGTEALPTVRNILEDKAIPFVPNKPHPKAAAQTRIDVVDVSGTKAGNFLFREVARDGGDNHWHKKKGVIVDEAAPTVNDLNVMY